MGTAVDTEGSTSRLLGQNGSIQQLDFSRSVLSGQ